MKDGNIAVSDYDNKWISVHEPSGKFVSKVRLFMINVITIFFLNFFISI